MLCYKFIARNVFRLTVSSISNQTLSVPPAAQRSAEFRSSVGDEQRLPWSTPVCPTPSLSWRHT